MAKTYISLLTPGVASSKEKKWISLQTPTSSTKKEKTYVSLAPIPISMYIDTIFHVVDDSLQWGGNEKDAPFYNPSIDTDKLLGPGFDGDWGKLGDQFFDDLFDSIIDRIRTEGTTGFGLAGAVGLAVLGAALFYGARGSIPFAQGYWYIKKRQQKQAEAMGEDPGKNGIMVFWDRIYQVLKDVG